MGEHSLFVGSHWKGIYLAYSLSTNFVGTPFYGSLLYASLANGDLVQSLLGLSLGVEPVGG